MQTNYNTITLHFLMLLTICIVAQILSQNTPRFMKIMRDYTIAIPDTSQRNI